jgi:histidinol-phosphatase (PHP family)
MIKQFNIPVVVNSDAHQPEKINAGRREALLALQENGFSVVMEFHGGKWEEKLIDTTE